jgi:hypothetical protein
LVSQIVMLDGIILLLLGTASLPPETVRGLDASLLVVYWVVTLSSALVVYQKTTFSAQKDSGCCVSCPPLPNAFRTCNTPGVTEAATIHLQ